MVDVTFSSFEWIFCVCENFFRNWSFKSRIKERDPEKAKYQLERGGGNHQVNEDKTKEMTKDAINEDVQSIIFATKQHHHHYHPHCEWDKRFIFTWLPPCLWHPYKVTGFFKPFLPPWASRHVRFPFAKFLIFIFTSKSLFFRERKRKIIFIFWIIKWSKFQRGYIIKMHGFKEI